MVALIVGNFSWIFKLTRNKRTDNIFLHPITKEILQMKLLTKEIIKKLPKLYATEEIELRDKTVVCKFFCPWSSWTWYVIEMGVEDGETLFWGYVKGFEGEFGYFTLSELESIIHRSGLKIERDRWFDPCKVSEIKDIVVY